MTSSMLRIVWLTSAATLGLAIPLRSQQVLYDFGGFGGAHFGWVCDGIGDVNADGFPDLIAGAPEDNDVARDAGRVIVFSGRDGTQIYELFGESEGDHFGEFVSGPGDVNRDGTPDFLISALFGDGSEPGSGYAELRSGVDASVIFRFNGDLPGDVFGDTANAAGDTNNDGWIDIVVGGRGSDGNGIQSGMARVYSGFDGSTLHTFYGTTPGALFGSATDGAGDINDDGYDDIVVGAKGTVIDGMANAGQAQVFSGFDGSVLLQVDGRSVGDGLGKGIAGLGDVNGDGVLDIAIGAWQVFNESPMNQGFVLVASTDDAHPVYTVYGDNTHDSMGVWVDTAGDANRDGFLDFVVGAPHYDCSDFNTGLLRVISGKDGSVIYQACGYGGGDGLAHHVTMAGDVNQDGYDDVIAGAYWNDFAGHDAGAVYVFSGCPAVIERVGTGLVGGNGLPPNLAGCGKLEGDDPLTLRVINARPSTTAALIIGLSELNVSFKGGLLVPSPDLLIFLQTGADGSMFLEGTWPDGLPPQVQTFYQLWLSDPEAPAGWAASNGLRAVTP